MKKLSLLLLVVFITSCIPSLHPIFNDSTRIVDDRIVGVWGNDNSSKVDVNIAVDGDNSQEFNDLIKDKIFKKVLREDQRSEWQFERAINVTYELNNGTSKSKVDLSSQRRSHPRQKLLDKGYEITSEQELPYYILTYSSVEEGELLEDVMVVHLTEIGGTLYMDFAPYQELLKPSRFVTNFIPAHTFAKLNFENGNLLIQSFDSDYLEKLIEKKRIRLKHEKVDDTIVLTASTDDLRAFIEKYGSDEELFVEADVLTTI